MVLATTGPRRVAPTTRKNVSDSERAVSAAVGGLLVASGLKKRGIGGLALAFVGAELLRRGATGHCMLYEAIGFSSDSQNGSGDSNGPGGTHRSDVTGAAATVNARKAIKVERAIIIDRPASELYEFWRDFRNLSKVLDDIESVSDLGNGRSRWAARGPGGTRIEWDAEIVNDLPDELIAWKTIGEPDIAHAGSVHFKPVVGGTEVRFVMDYEPPAGRLTAVAAKVFGGSPDQWIRADLMRLKILLERP